ncbi:hypothetical protein MD484_g6740, partial [Candolleomyces efflorescens]
MRTRSSAKSARSVSVDVSLDEQKKLAAQELGEVLSLEDDTFAHSLYHHLAPDGAIDNFLRKTRSYSLAKRRWNLPRSYTKLLNNDTHTPFLNILASILKHFWNEPNMRGKRVVVDTHATSLSHTEAKSTRHSSSPSFVIKAEGPSFQLPECNPGETPTPIGFSNVASCIDLQIHEADSPVPEQLSRLVIYARQIFIQQPNRRFARLLVLSEDHFRLFHFDRSGVQYTPSIDFHQNPHTFVRLILGLSSPDESDIGLDTSVQWTVEKGRKVGGTLTSRGADGTELIYPLSSTVPFFFRGSIRGRSTTCWGVRDPITGEDLVVKDAWKSEGTVSEHLYLQDAVGTPGVVQMVSCEPGRGETKHLRGFNHAIPAGFQNRIETRVVMKAYGKPLDNFTSAMQLLCALRDAIAGHMDLYLKNQMLHQDISLYNILLGVAGADPGYRGILIDFDMAIRCGSEASRKPDNWKIGTRHFQSAAVLSSSDFVDPLPRDHLDDLESFFYVLAHIFWVYDPEGKFHSIPERVEGWDHPNPILVATRKQAFLSWTTPPVTMEKRWPIPCLNLLLAFQAFLRPLVAKKFRLNEEPADARRDEAEVFVTDVAEHYSHVLQLFDEAIEMMDKPRETWKLSCDLDPDELWAQYLALFPFPHIQPQHDNPLKRNSEDYPDDQPPSQRLHV